MTLIYRKFSFTPETLNEENRTVDLVASTGAGVVRQDMDGQYLEVLSLKPGAVDLSRVDGAPLLDTHRQGGLENVLGALMAARIENGLLIVSVRISERAAAIWADVKSGIIRNASVGYSVQKYVDSVDPKTGQRLRTATEWTLMETSLVPIGADPGAKIRSYTMHQDTPASANRAATNAEIRALGTTFAIDGATINGLIDREASADEARAAILEAMKGKRTAPAPHVTMGISHESPESFVRNASEALFARAHPAHKLSEPARPLANMTTVELAKECLRLRSVSTIGLAPGGIIERALHSTSDFPELLTGTGDRTLRAAYQAIPSVLKTVARQTTAADFRAKHRLQLSEAPTLQKVNEQGEFKSGTMAEAKESYSISTYGRIIGLTRQAIVNDDLGAFTQLAAAFGQSAADFEAQFLVDLIESGSGLGPTMADGKTLFHADHANKAASGGAPSENTISAARLAMRKQTGLSGKRISVSPKYILVPADIETATEKLLASVQAATTSAVNPFAAKFELLVDARLSSATRWWMISDPAVLEGLEYSYLQGQEGPQTETRAGFEVDGVEMKCRLDFGAAFIEYRGWYTNAGA